MEKIKKILGFTILLLVSVSANAVIIGDKDWLQLADARSGYNQNWFNWTDFDAVFDADTGECDVDGCLVVVDLPLDDLILDLTGYTWASNSDVNELFKSYTGVDIGGTLKDGALDGFFTDFWPTYNDSNGAGTDIYIQGWTRDYTKDGQGEIDAGYMWASQFYPNGLDNGGTTAEQGYMTQEVKVCSDGCREGMPGGWFYREVAVVPAPPAIWLFITGSIGLFGFRKSRKAP